MTELITTRCVGSGAPRVHALCPVCGRPFPRRGETIPNHRRMDVAAMDQASADIRAHQEKTT